MGLFSDCVSITVINQEGDDKIRGKYFNLRFGTRTSAHIFNLNTVYTLYNERFSTDLATTGKAVLQTACRDLENKDSSPDDALFGPE